MQQITGGFVPTEEEEVIETDSNKLNLVKDFLGDYSKDKLIIFARFRPEIKAVKDIVDDKEYSVRTLTGDTEDRGDLIKSFQKKKDPQVLVIQIQTGGLGITLTTTDTVIFYSTNFSYADYEQAKARVHRIGQHNVVNYIHLITKETIDEEVIQALREKKELAKLVVDKYKTQKGRETSSHPQEVDAMSKED